MLETIANTIDAMTTLIAKLAVVLVLTLVGLIGWNVVGRYIIGNASVAMQELEWHLLAPIALFGMAVLMKDNGHVRVDMVYERLSRRVQLMLDTFSMVMGVVFSVLAIKYAVPYVATSWATLEGSPDPGGLPYRFVLKALIPAGFAVLGLQCLANAIRNVLALKMLRS